MDRQTAILHSPFTAAGSGSWQSANRFTNHVKVLSWKHSRWSTVEGPLSKEHYSSEARLQGASLLVYTYIQMLGNLGAKISCLAF